MQLALKDNKKRPVSNHEEIKFSSFSSYHLLALTARVKGKKQISGTATDDEDLTVEIDGKTFPKLKSTDRLIDSPAAFSGGRLHNLAKTVYFLVFLKGKGHSVLLKTDDPSGSATFEGLEVYTLNLIDKLVLEPKLQAEDGDRRQWVTFALSEIPLKEFSTKITYTRRKRDSDDVKVIIDGRVQRNLSGSIKHFLWSYVGSFLPWVSATKTEVQTFSTNLPPGLHYLELEADRMPVLETVTFNFGQVLPVPEDIPTVDNPRTVGDDFLTDTEELLLARMILGETERQPVEAKTAVAYSVLNRLKKQNPKWGLSVREIILMENQYDGLWNKNTYEKVRDPLKDISDSRKVQWKECYDVALSVLSGKVPDPARATHLHSFTNKEEFPPWATDDVYKIKLGAIYFYDLER